MKFINENSRSIGFAIPLVSVRTGFGPCGEFLDIPSLGALVKSWNMNLLQLLPVNDTGMQTSPYSALSAYALNPLYLRIEDLPEARGDRSEAVLARSDAHALARQHAGDAKVAYRDILSEKLRILESLWEASSRGAQGALLTESVDEWAKAHSWAKPYACFVELKREHGDLPWWEWSRVQEAKCEDLDRLLEDKEFEGRARFRIWLQMRAEEQFRQACEACAAMGVDIMGDIPILMNSDSADVWFERHIFNTELSAGAPPDMYSAMGQNWGFPLYRWDVLERHGFSFWKERLRSASAFYTAYRIDHVLGFFRIWAIGKQEKDGFLGSFEPEYHISYPELASLGFDAGRIRWLSQPHVPGWALRSAMSSLPESVRDQVLARLFSRIGDEDLYLFSEEVKGSADISNFLARLSSGSDVRSCDDALCAWWRNRAFLEVKPGSFIPTWHYESTRAWETLLEREKSTLNGLISRRKSESQVLWEKMGRKILKVLVDCVSMQACAEDLGAVPPCVPAVLADLGIPGLRVLRWHREWAQEGHPFIPLGDYPENTVACTSVHDSSMLRQWWEEEADKQAVWNLAREALRNDSLIRLDAVAPETLDTESLALLLRACTKVPSKYLVFPLQDILAASEVYRESWPGDERINVPGTSNETNWVYRMKPDLSVLCSDETFASKIKGIFVPLTSVPNDSSL
jgi:4-alpha-glucanotransferase